MNFDWAFSGNHYLKAVLLVRVVWISPQKHWGVTQWVLPMHDGGTFTIATVVKQTRTMCKKPPFLLLMDWNALQGAKLCIYGCGEIKNLGACPIFQKVSIRQNLAGEGAWGDIFIHTIHILRPQHHTTIQHPLCCWLITFGIPFLLWLSWQCS